MGGTYLREQESAGASGFSQLEDKVMKTAAQFFGEDLLPYAGVKGRIARVAWRLQSMSIWRCAGWKKTSISS